MKTQTDSAMIICTVCKTENDRYATVCKKCGGFLQNKVPNLDLFNTFWRIIENPSDAFKIIALSEHKNYAWLIYCLFGINIIFIEFWAFGMGDKFGNLLTLILGAMIAGIPSGICLCLAVCSIHCILSKIGGGKGSFRISLGITSYSLMPMIISLFIILPIKLSIFGMYLFTFNPHPMALKPALYIILIVFDVLLLVWSFLLLVAGTRVGSQISLWKSILIISIIYMAIIEIIYVGGSYIPKLIQWSANI
jgi:hypothetical protein